MSRYDVVSLSYWCYIIVFCVQWVSLECLLLQLNSYYVVGNSCSQPLNPLKMAKRGKKPVAL